jgi:hypothetical protein
MSMFSRCALLAVLAALALAWPTAAVSQPSPGITVLDPDKLEITGDSVKTLTIRNDTSATVGLQFSAEPGEEDGSGGTTGGATTPGGAKVTVLPSTSTALQAHAVGQFDLEISADKPFDGYLSVGVNGAYQSDQGNGTQIPLSIRTAPWWKQPTPVVLEALLFGIVFVLMRWVAALLFEDRRIWKPSALMGGVEWDLSKSFGSAVGLFAGVITALAESGLLPDTDTTSGVTLFGLSLIFAVLILLAPVTYTVFQTRINAQPADQEEIVGRVWAFAVTSAITIGAVAGQLWTSYLMLEELHGRDVLGMAIRLVEAAVLAAGILLVVHFWRTIGWIVEKQHREAQRQYARAGVSSTLIDKNKVSVPLADRPRWTPL